MQQMGCIRVARGGGHALSIVGAGAVSGASGVWCPGVPVCPVLRGVPGLGVCGVASGLPGTQLSLFGQNV